MEGLLLLNWHVKQGVPTSTSATNVIKLSGYFFVYSVLYDTKTIRNEDSHVSVYDQTTIRPKATGLQSETWFHSVVHGKNISNLNILRQLLFLGERVNHVSRIINMQKNIFDVWNMQGKLKCVRNVSKITVWCAVHSNGWLDRYYLFNKLVRRDLCFQMLNTYIQSEA